jgi:hypothetical protein
MPMTSPRRRTNQRLATAARSTSAVMPVPPPPTILGVIPLAVAKGAAAEMRRSLGTAVSLGVTGFGLNF